MEEGKEKRREVLMRVDLAGMALLLIANLLSPWLVTPPLSYSARGKHDQWGRRSGFASDLASYAAVGRVVSFCQV